MLYCVFYTPAPVIYFDKYTNEELYLFTVYTAVYLEQSIC